MFYDPGGAAAAGFDAVIGNPPWEMVRATARPAERDCRADPIVKFVRESGLFPHCGHGHSTSISLSSNAA